MTEQSYRAAMSAAIREPAVERDWREVSVVAPFKPAACAGMLGVRCSCGQWHQAPDDGPGLLVSAEFWIGALACVLAWSGFALALLDYFKR